MKVLSLVSVAFALLLASVSTSSAWHLFGRVVCRGEDGTLTPLPAVVVVVTNTSGTFEDTGTTDTEGWYYVPLPEIKDCYGAYVVPASLPASVNSSIPLVPAGGVLEFCLTDSVIAVDDGFFFFNCGNACWLTGGGVKFEPVVGLRLAERGPSDTLGGNVYPGCSPTAGDGGQWNHVAHTLKLHFQGWAIQVVRCGNVEGIPPGSDSPKTPFNFIEFMGTGTLKGIKNNKVNYDRIYFFARCEDRNEPGSKGAKDGALIDRYFLHVFSDLGNPNGSTLLLIDQDGDPSTVDPILITGGNLQIHISSCDNPPL